MNKYIISLLILCISSAFSCEKEDDKYKGLPEHVKASMKVKKAQHEYTCIFATPEEEKAIADKNFNERVAIVREMMKKNNISQTAMTDQQASDWYIKEMSKQVMKDCKQQ